MVQVTVLYTAPTAIRALQSFGDKFVTQHSRKTLRILGTVGEPINPEAWKWYHEVRRSSPPQLPCLRGAFCWTGNPQAGHRPMRTALRARRIAGCTAGCASVQ